MPRSPGSSLGRLAAAAAAAAGCFAAAGDASWDYSRQGTAGGWDQLCSGRFQSPIDIEPKMAVRGDLQLRLLYSPWTQEDISYAGVEEDGVPRVKFKEDKLVGKIQVGTGYSDYDEYVLTSVEVHSPSEHTLRKASWAVELQLWHEPMALRRIKGLRADAQDLEQAVDAAHIRFSAMGEADEKLRTQTIGQSSPWQEVDATQHPQQMLDWVDATKDDIRKVGLLLREDTKAQLNRSFELEAQVKGVLGVQRRHFASHRVALSIFVLRASPVFLGAQNGTATSLVQWLSEALSASRITASSSDEARQTAAPGRSFSQLQEVIDNQPLYSYEGSIPRPPCTPNVRWFVVGEPQASDMQQLAMLLEAAQLGGTMEGNARQVQPFGQSRRLHKADLAWKAFEAPALQVLSDSMHPSRLKLLWITRYCKVFVLTSVFLISTPFLFWVARKCCVEDLEEDATSALRLPFSAMEEDHAAGALTLSPWTPRGRGEDDGLGGREAPSLPHTELPALPQARTAHTVPSAS